MSNENGEFDPCTLLEEVVALSHEAGRRILAVYERADHGVTEKDDRSPLTEADMASHHAIVAGLRRIAPDIPVLSEESSDVPWETRRQWRRYWLIDPLDGTKEFIKRNGEFTVNIALIEDGRPVLGVVHVPVLDLTYYACRGGGAWRRRDGEAPERIRVRERCGEPVVVAGSRSHRGDSLNRFLERLGEHELISMGSALKLCLVAEGRADVYPRLGPTSEWDTAAAQAVVEEAGGRVTDLDLRPLRYNSKESLLNPYFIVFGDASRDWKALLGESEG